jgi:hypothetical protein
MTKFSLDWCKQYDSLGCAHLLPVGVGEYKMKVEMTTGGEYALTCCREGDPSGGGVDYFPTLGKAKTHAEHLVKTGRWRELSLSPEPA